MVASKFVPTRARDRQLRVLNRLVIGKAVGPLRSNFCFKPLVITEGTAEVHVKRILNKLGLKSRAQVAA